MVRLNRSLLLAVIVLLPATPGPAAVTPSSEAGAAAGFPQQRLIPGYSLTLNAPQVRTWTDFAKFTSTIAFSLTPSGQAVEHFGTATVAGDTTVDMDRRIVTIHSPKVTDVTFTNPVPDEYTSAVMDATTRTSLDVRLDLFLAYLADEVLSQPAPAGFNTEPPPIVVPRVRPLCFSSTEHRSCRQFRIPGSKSS
jgi:hypothetical protein